MKLSKLGEDEHNKVVSSLHCSLRKVESESCWASYMASSDWLGCEGNKRTVSETDTTTEQFIDKKVYQTRFKTKRK